MSVWSEEERRVASGVEEGRLRLPGRGSRRSGALSRVRALGWRRQGGGSCSQVGEGGSVLRSGCEAGGVRVGVGVARFCFRVRGPQAAGFLGQGWITV